MDEKKLPRPVTATDFYLKAVLDELQGLRADLAAKPEAAPDGLIDLREAAPDGLIDLREPAVEATPLPEDFPGRDALIAAGYTVLEMVPRKGKDLTAVSNIGPVTANQILTWFEVSK